MSQLFPVKLLNFVIFPAIFFVYGTSIAEDYRSPETIEGSIKINAEALIELAREHDDLVMIDSRIHADRHQGYIAGSISLPNTETRYHATLARLGGDEFGLLLPSAETKEQAIKVAQRIIEALNRPFKIDEHDIDIECKIGISIYPVHGEDEKFLIRNADKAMAQAKASEQSVSVFDAE